MFPPHLLWQAAHDWPTLEFMRNATGKKMAPIAPLQFLARQILIIGFGNAIVWIMGLGYALFARGGRPARLFAWIYPIVLALLLSGGRSRTGYLAVAYPALFALGGVAWERRSLPAGSDGGSGRRCSRARLPACSGCPSRCRCCPSSASSATRPRWAASRRTEEKHRWAVLRSTTPTCTAGRRWPGSVARAAGAHDERSGGADRVRDNYGEAGRSGCLARPAAAHRRSAQLLVVGAAAWDGSVVIIMGRDNAEWRNATGVGTVDHPLAMPYERDLPIVIARDFRPDLAVAWKQGKHYQ